MKITIAKLRKIIRETIEEEAWPPGRWYPGSAEPVSNEEIDTMGIAGMGLEEPEDEEVVHSLGEAGRKRKKKKSGEDLKGACWSGYTAVGLKPKGGRMVPNCVPKGSAK